MAIPNKNGYVKIGDLKEGDAVTYEYGTFDFKTGQTTSHNIDGYVGPRHQNRGGKEKVVLMRNKAGARYGSLALNTSVKLR